MRAAFGPVSVSDLVELLDATLQVAFLDRGLVIGTFTDPHLGFFSDLDM